MALFYMGNKIGKKWKERKKEGGWRREEKEQG